MSDPCTCQPGDGQICTHQVQEILDNLTHDDGEDGNQQ